MSAGDARKVSRQDIQLVQNLIERCLQLYMSQKEVVHTLLMQAKIEPSFTELVWQKLEEENREFFKAYHVRLIVKNQIMMFNQLLEKQAQLMREMQPSGVAPSSLSNGSSVPSLNQTPLQYVHPKPEHAPCPVLPSTVINGGHSPHQGIQVGNGSPLGPGRIDMSSSMLPVNNQNMHIGVMQGMNGTAVKLEPGFSGNAEFAFCNDGGFLEERPALGDATGSSFGCSELNGPSINEPILDTDASSFGFLSQIPRNFSFSDLTDHDILESYGKSPFLGQDSQDFSRSPGRDPEGENRRLDTISEVYDGFGRKHGIGGSIPSCIACQQIYLPSCRITG